MTSGIEFPAYVIGLMSGTSADGVDAALLWTDGRSVARAVASASQPYDDALRADILALMRGQGDRARIAQALTEIHRQAVEALIGNSGVPREQIALIGFHGQTIEHRPEEGYTVQIGDAPWLAEKTGIPVVHDFRSNDIRHGGQGAPLVPLYHAALAHDLPKPVMIVNIGGVANYTWIGAGEWIEAADCGPGNALLDDWMGMHTGARCDEDGAMAKRGIVHEATVKQFLRDTFFVQNRARSLDRNHFSIESFFPAVPDVPERSYRWEQARKQVSIQDGAATLTAITAAAIGWSARAVPEMPQQLLITGGGRHNPILMKMIAERAHIPALPVEAVGWNGDMLEAEAFAYLAARSMQGLALSLPETTGVKEPVSGGIVCWGRRG
jgi:anhydro-N-acetylmuramic acid kinase